MSTLFGILQTDINPHFSSYGPEGQGFESLTACQEKALNLNGSRLFSFSLAVWSSWFLALGAQMGAQNVRFLFDLNPFQRLERVDFLWQEYEQIGKGIWFIMKKAVRITQDSYCFFWVYNNFFRLYGWGLNQCSCISSRNSFVMGKPDLSPITLSTQQYGQFAVWPSSIQASILLGEKILKQ